MPSGRAKTRSGIMPRWLTLTVALFAAAMALSCGGAEKTADTGLKVFVAIPPQKYFVDRIGGSYVEAGVLIPAGQNAHTYEPTPQQMTEMGNARVYFQAGLLLEDRVLAKAREVFPNLEIVDCRKGITLMPMTEVDTDQPQGAAKEGLDPHFWLDPKLAKIMAHTMADTLKGLDTAHAGEFAKRLAALDADLDAVDARIRAALAPLATREFLVYHPAFGYFAKAYDLKQVPVETLGKEPSARELTGIIDRAKRENIKVIFVQPQFSKRGAEAIAEAIGGAVVPLDDLAYDYVRNLEDIAQRIEKALAQESAR